MWYRKDIYVKLEIFTAVRQMSLIKQSLEIQIEIVIVDLKVKLKVNVNVKLNVSNFNSKYLIDLK